MAEGCSADEEHRPGIDPQPYPSDDGTRFFDFDAYDDGRPWETPTVRHEYQGDPSDCDTEPRFHWRDHTHNYQNWSIPQQVTQRSDGGDEYQQQAGASMRQHCDELYNLRSCGHMHAAGESDKYEQPQQNENYQHDSKRHNFPSKNAFENRDSASADERAGEDAFLAPAHEAYWKENPLSSALNLVKASNCGEQGGGIDIDLVNIEDLVDWAAVNRYERWDVDKDAADMLASVMALTKEARLSAVCAGYTRFSRIRLEEPLLPSDPETDMIRLVERNTISLKDHEMRIFELDDDKDQSWKWSRKNLELPAQLEAQVISAKLAVEQETMEFLKEIHDGPKCSLQSYLADQNKEKPPVCPMTPPLLPLSPPFSPDRLPSPVAQMQLTSTPEDPSAREILELEKLCLERDNIDMQHEAEFAAEDSWFRGDTLVSSSPQQGKSKSFESFKVSSPLLPYEPETSEPPLKKVKLMTFPEETLGMIPHVQSHDASEDAIADFDEASTAIAEIITPLAQPAIQQSCNEELSEADTLLRVPVPPIEDVKPEPPWGRSPAEARSGNGDEVQRLLPNETRQAMMRKWGGVHRLEKELPWSPFPSRLGKITPKEDIDEEDLISTLAALELDGLPDIRVLTWKPDGIRILDVDEWEEDDLEPAIVEEAANCAEAEAATEAEKTIQDYILPKSTATSGAIPVAMTKPVPIKPALQKPSLGHVSEKEQKSWTKLDELLQKRRAGFEKEEGAKEARNKAAVDTRSVTKDDRAVAKPATSNRLEQQRGTINQHGLLNFSRHHGWSEAPRAQPIQPHAPATEANIPPVTAPISPGGGMITTPKPQMQLPAPQLPACSNSLAVIVSHTLMQNRALVRGLRALLPGLEFVERDFSSPAATAAPLWGSVAAAATIAPPPPPQQQQQMKARRRVREEADLTLSPSTGIIFTDLQRLKQRPLPGRKEASSSPFPGIYEQVATTAPRYERLLVLIRDGTTALPPDAEGEREEALPPPVLDESDCEELAHFASQTAALDTDVQPIYVAGGEAELARWTAGLISRHGCGASGGDGGEGGGKRQAFPLLAEETLWERFLRAAGLNAFAAQAVLEVLKPRGPLAAAVAAAAAPTGTSWPEEEEGEEVGDEVEWRRGRGERRSENFERRWSGGNSAAQKKKKAGLAVFVAMSAEERLRRFAPLMGGERVLRRVNRVVDHRWG